MEILKDFRDLIPALSKDEYDRLEKSIIEEGCRHPLIVWKEKDILLDGHNRHEICTGHGIPFKTEYKSFDDESGAMSWMIDNQLSRRNLKPDQISLLIGQRYNLEKKTITNPNGLGGKAGKIDGDQNDPQQSTAEKIASQHGVSAPTVKRSAKFADAVKVLIETGVAPDLQEQISKGVAPAKKKIIEAAKLATEKPEEAKEVLNIKSKHVKTANVVPLNGLEYAIMAIGQLQKINKNDGQRDKAFDKVIKWIKDNR